MDKIFETAIFNRKTLIHFIENLSYEQLVKIPENFNNSIIWNIGHLLVTNQLLIYNLSGLPIDITNEIVEKYSKGSKATQNVSKEEIQYIKENLMPLILKVQKDYKQGIFKEYNPYETSVHISLNNIDEALQFSAYHDGIHLGVILSLKKVV